MKVLNLVLACVLTGVGTNPLLACNGGRGGSFQSGAGFSMSMNPAAVYAAQMQQYQQQAYAQQLYQQQQLALQQKKQAHREIYLKLKAEKEAKRLAQKDSANSPPASSAKSKSSLTSISR